MLPYSFASSVMSALSGVAMSRIGQYRIIMQFAFAVFTIGMGLMTRLDGNSSTYVLANSCHDVNLSDDSGQKRFCSRWLRVSASAIYSKCV